MTPWLLAVAVAALVLVTGRGASTARLGAVLPRPGRDLAERAGVGSAGASGEETVSRHRWAWSGAAVCGGIAGALTELVLGGPPPVALVTAVAPALVSRWLRRRQRDRAAELVELAAVEVALGLAGELRAGSPPATALDHVAHTAGPLSGVCAGAAAAAALGRSAAQALRAAAERGSWPPTTDERGQPVTSRRARRSPPTRPRSRLDQLAGVWEVCETSGVAVAAVLESLAESWEADQALRAELDASLAGPRSTVVLLAVLPGLGIALGEAIGAHPLRLLLDRPAGWALLTGAVVLDGMGVLLTRRIVAVALDR